MKHTSRILAALLGALLALAASAAHAQVREGGGRGQVGISATDFAAWMNDSHVPARATGFRYVFIPGFLNEGMPGYFKDNVQELRRAGVPAQRIHVLAPCSAQDPQANIGELRGRIANVAAQGPEKIVLIGHSKGAVETLLFALTEPGFVERRVQAVFLLQGAFGGSGVADYLSGKGRPVSIKMPPLERAAFEVAAWKGTLVSPVVRAGLASLTQASSRALWRRVAREKSDAVRRVGSKIFYITGAEHPRGMGELLDCVGWYLHTSYGPNDGLVALEDQSVAGIGKRIATLSGDHADLVIPAPIGNAPVSLRYRMTAGIMHAAAALD